MKSDGKGNTNEWNSKIIGKLFRSLFVANADEEETDGYPDEFADAGEEASKHAVCALHAQGIGDECKTAFTSAHLHGDEEEEVGKEGGEGLYEYAVAVGDVGGEDEEDEHYLDATEQAGEELERKAEVEGAATLAVKGGDLRIDVADVLCMFGGETLYVLADEGQQSEDAERTTCQPVAIAHEEEVNAKEAEQCHKCEKAQREGIEVCGTQDDEEHHGEGPEAEVRKDVHHGVEDDTAGGLRCAHVGAELHYAVGLAAEQSHWCDVVESVARDGVFEHAPEADAVLLSVVEDDLPRAGVDHVYWQPEHDDGGQPDAGTPHVFQHIGPRHVEGAEHNDYRHHADGEEDVAILRLHRYLRQASVALGFLMAGFDCLRRRKHAHGHG